MDLKKNQTTTASMFGRCIIDISLMNVCIVHKTCSACIAFFAAGM